MKDKPIGLSLVYIIDLGLLNRVDYVSRGLGLPVHATYTSIVYAVIQDIPDCIIRFTSPAGFTPASGNFADSKCSLRCELVSLLLFNTHRFDLIACPDIGLPMPPFADRSAKAMPYTCQPDGLPVLDSICRYHLRLNDRCPDKSPHNHGRAMRERTI